METTDKKAKPKYQCKWIKELHMAEEDMRKYDFFWQPDKRNPTGTYEAEALRWHCVVDAMCKTWELPPFASVLASVIISFIVPSEIIPDQPYGNALTYDKKQIVTHHDDIALIPFYPTLQLYANDEHGILYLFKIYMVCPKKVYNQIRDRFTYIVWLCSLFEVAPSEYCLANTEEYIWWEEREYVICYTEYPVYYFNNHKTATVSSNFIIQ